MSSKKIKLTQGKYALVDTEDFEFLNQWKWQFKKKRSENTGYAGCKFFGGMHRFLLIAKESETIDHENGNGLDNRRSNLRVSSHAENMWNMTKHKRNTTGYKGVHYLKAKKRVKRYYAALQVNGVVHTKGMFRTAKEAHFAYMCLAKKYHKEFARWK